MDVFAKRLAAITSFAFLCTVTFLTSTQPAASEVDCTKPTKTNFEAGTCSARRQAGLIKSEPPTTAKREPVPARPRLRPGATWEEREKDARFLCDRGMIMSCWGYHTWLANNPKPRN